MNDSLRHLEDVGIDFPSWPCPLSYSPVGQLYHQLLQSYSPMHHEYDLHPVLHSYRKVYKYMKHAFVIQLLWTIDVIGVICMINSTRPQNIQSAEYQYCVIFVNMTSCLSLAVWPPWHFGLYSCYIYLIVAKNSSWP